MKRRTKLKILIFVLLIALAGTVGYGVKLYIDMNKEPEIPETNLPVLKNVEFEEGKVLLVPENFLDVSKLSEEDLENLEMYSNIMTDKGYQYDGSTKTVVSKGKGYLKKGEYMMEITLGEDRALVPFKVVHSDTKSEEPIVVEEEQDEVNASFVAPYTEVYVEQGANVDFRKYFLAISDGKKVDVTIDGNIDINTEGDYKVTVKAGNASCDVIFKVINVETMAVHEFEYTPYIDGSIPLLDHTLGLIYAEAINFYYSELNPEITNAIQANNIDVSSYRTSNCWNMFD